MVNAVVVATPAPPGALRAPPARSTTSGTLNASKSQTLWKSIEFSPFFTYTTVCIGYMFLRSSWFNAVTS
ncbi:hypothetical protein RSAG8_10919, partial [Rhizoctonia solani AG-8 WAC10335]